MNRYEEAKKKKKAQQFTHAQTRWEGRAEKEKETASHKWNVKMYTKPMRSAKRTHWHKNHLHHFQWS